MTQTDYPDDAEVHLLSDFVKDIAGKESNIVPGKRQAPHQRFYCPVCREELFVPKHGVEEQCYNCSLHWLALGNTLYIWKNEGHNEIEKTLLKR